MAISTFKNLSRPVQAEEMFAVGKFFLASFRARMTRGKIPAAIRSGFRALTISRFLHADKISLEIIPDLFYILLSRRRIQEAIDLLNLLQYAHKTLTTEWETWYYALCIDLILDAGFQLESPNVVTQFAEHALHKGLLAGPSRRRLIIGLWTYWLRAEADRKARQFESEALFWTAYEDDDGNLNTLFSSMRLAEGMLESLARKMDDLRKVVDLMELRSIADRELIRLEKDCRLMRIAYPRWLLLKSYSLSLSGRQNSAMTTSNHIIKMGSQEELNGIKATSDLSKYETIVLDQDQILIPGFVDCHTHAPQFPNIGLGLDRPLLEWLDKYTFPLESKYVDANFAKSIYEQVVKRLITNGTTAACYFGSLHLEGTLELVNSVTKQGQRAIVGKVSMNIENDAGYYNDTAKELSEVEIFVQKVLALKNDLVAPVITPRFAVSCDEKLMNGLSEIANRYNCRIQSHISENLKEIEHVLSINPGSNSYSEVYDKSNILNNKCIMAHAVYLSDNEMALLAKKGVSVAHCPSSNTRLRSGLCPVRKLLNKGLTVGLGTDVSGGDSATILDAMRRAMDVSTHLDMVQGTQNALNWKEAFYLATLGGAKALRLDDKVGSFEVGKEFDALVVNIYEDKGQIDRYPYSMEENDDERIIGLLQRFIYVGDDRNITRVYVKGTNVKK